MIRVLICYFFFTSLTNIVISQKRCGTTDYFNKSILANPKIHFEYNSISESIQNSPMDRYNIRVAVDIIPVVFHVIYRNEQENISKGVLLDQIDALNRDFNGLNQNTRYIPDQFKHLLSNIDIEFCLAEMDPMGFSREGIMRVPTTEKAMGLRKTENQRSVIHYSQFGGSDPWPPERYLNIWIADMDGLYGRSSLPGAELYPAERGIVIDPQWVGPNPVDTKNQGRTATHEVGHYFGLLHPWGMERGDCIEFDLVDDTPDQADFYLGCPTTSNSSCGTIDLPNTFMDLVDDPCMALFTHGQKSKMLATIQKVYPDLLQSKEKQYLADVDLSQWVIYTQRKLLHIIPPAPFKNRINYQMLDINGREVINGNMYFEHRSLIPISNIPTGIYVLSFHLNGNVFSKKLFVE